MTRLRARRRGTEDAGRNLFPERPRVGQGIGVGEKESTWGILLGVADCWGVCEMKRNGGGGHRKTFKAQLRARSLWTLFEDTP